MSFIFESNPLNFCIPFFIKLAPILIFFLNICVFPLLLFIFVCVCVQDVLVGGAAPDNPQNEQARAASGQRVARVARASAARREPQLRVGRGDERLFGAVGRQAGGRGERQADRGDGGAHGGETGGGAGRPEESLPHHLPALHHDPVRASGALRHRQPRLQHPLVQVDHRPPPAGLPCGNKFLFIAS